MICRNFVPVDECDTLEVKAVKNKATPGATVWITATERDGGWGEREFDYFITPDEARAMAALLWQTANEAESEAQNAD